MPRSRLIPLLIAMLIFVTLGISGGLLNIAWIYMRDTFHLPGGAIGILLLFATSGGLMSSMASGTVIGKFGIGRALLIALMVTAIGLAGIALSPFWILILFITFMTYSGKGMLDSGLNNFVSENYGTSSMNWLHASWGMGLTIAPFIMTFILIDMQLSWRAGYLLMAIVTVLVGLPVLFNLKQWTVSHTDDEDAPEKLKVIRASATEALREPAVLWSVLFFFLYGAVEIGTGQLVNILFVEGRNVSQEISGFWLSMYWGSFTVGRMMLGLIALRINDKILLNSSLALMTTGAFLLTTNLFPAMNIIALMLMGIGLAGIFPTLISQTPARVTRRFSAQSIGFQVGFAGLGGSIIPGIISYIAAQTTLEVIAYGIFAVALLTVLVYVVLTQRYPLTKPSATAQNGFGYNIRD